MTEEHGDKLRVKRGESGALCADEKDVEIKWCQDFEANEFDVKIKKLLTKQQKMFKARDDEIRW